MNWIKSSFCSADKPQCVEVRQNGHDGTVQVRDSKDPEAATLTFTPEEWGAFVEGVKDSQFDVVHA